MIEIEFATFFSSCTVRMPEVVCIDSYPSSWVSETVKVDNCTASDFFAVDSTGGGEEVAWANDPWGGWSTRRTPSKDIAARGRRGRGVLMGFRSTQCGRWWVWWKRRAAGAAPGIQRARR
jgi:hypothetical protein